MGNNDKALICQDCFIALLATVAIRAVNLFISTHPVLAKISWYIGIVGFLIFFAYKFRRDNILQKELSRTHLADKVLFRSQLDSHDYDLIGTILCQLSSRKDKINYFFIFFFSALALSGDYMLIYLIKKFHFLNILSVTICVFICDNLCYV